MGIFDVGEPHERVHHCVLTSRGSVLGRRSIFPGAFALEQSGDPCRKPLPNPRAQEAQGRPQPAFVALTTPIGPGTQVLEHLEECASVIPLLLLDPGDPSGRLGVRGGQGVSAIGQRRRDLSGVDDLQGANELVA